jgi:hypothetical protein
MLHGEDAGRVNEESHHKCGLTVSLFLLVYLQLNKKKAKAEGKKCHTKAMWSQ